MALKNLLRFNNVKFGLGLILIIVFLSCKRSGMGYVRGTVVDISTGLPIEGIKVYITDSKYGSTNHKISGFDYSDENGNYEIQYYKKITHRYIIRAESNSKYFSDSFKGVEFRKFAYTIPMSPL
ncbi:MAG: hypothetical protein U0W65_17460 [Bacteroidia bacterium]